MDILGVLQLLWDSYTTYPALPLVGTGVLTVAMIIIAPFYFLLLLGAALYGLTKRDTPIVWNRPDDYDYSFEACLKRGQERRANAKQQQQR